jgi:mono/diheme cytochrome c family protein
MKLGGQVYGVHCGTCHLPTGKGSIDTGPSMVGNPVVQAADPASLINAILYGPELPTPAPPTTRMHMEGYADRLADDEIAALGSYLRNSWGNRGAPVSEDDVEKQR